MYQVTTSCWRWRYGHRHSADIGSTRTRQFISTTWPFSLRQGFDHHWKEFPRKSDRRSEPVNLSTLTASGVNPNCVDKLSAIISRWRGGRKFVIVNMWAETSPVYRNRRTRGLRSGGHRHHFRHWSEAPCFATPSHNIPGVFWTATQPDRILCTRSSTVSTEFS